MGSIVCICAKKSPTLSHESSHHCIKSPYSTNIFPLLKDRNSLILLPSCQSFRSIEISLEDFEILRQLGSGASGRIFLVKKKNSGKLYALKTIKKSEVSKKKQEEYTWNERIILQNNENPYIVNLIYSFQNEDFLFLVIDFLNGGDLFFHLRKEKRFSEGKTAFYAAEIFCALEYLHNKSYVYRDLKPENVLFDEKGHIKLVDFGLSKKIVIEEDNLCNSLVGTPEYVAPEVLLGQEYDFSADYWNLGCVIYEMLIGNSPFYDKSIPEMLSKIVEDSVEFPTTMEISKQAKALILALLEKNPQKRIKAEELKKSLFFKEIDWSKLEKKMLKPPFVPEVENVMDLKYFESRFVESELGDHILQNGNEDSQMLYDYYVNFSYKKRLESVADP